MATTIRAFEDEIMNDHRIRMGTDRRTDQIKRVFITLNDVFQRSVDGVAERFLPFRYGNDLRPEHFHPEHVQFLTFHIFLAHINAAFHSEQSRAGCRCDSVLAGTGFGDDSLFAHIAC